MNHNTKLNTTERENNMKVLPLSEPDALEMVQALYSSGFLINVMMVETEPNRVTVKIEVGSGMLFSPDEVQEKKDAVKAAFAGDLELTGVGNKRGIGVFTEEVAS